MGEHDRPLAVVGPLRHAARRCLGRIVTVDHLVAVVEFDPSDHALAIGLFQLRVTTLSGSNDPARSIASARM